MPPRSSAPPQFGPGALVVGLAVVVATLLAYAPILDNFFYPIDDPGLILHTGRGIDPTPRFRPLYRISNQLLVGTFGLRPFGWYLSGLLVHLANALLVAFIARRVSKNKIQAAVAGCAFAVFYSPHETVMWIAANCGLLSVLFVLLSGAAWLMHLDAPEDCSRRRWIAYGFALVFLMMAMGFKEDCVVAGPLLLGLHLARKGWRGVIRPRSLLLYAPPAALAVGYLLVAFRPSAWAGPQGADHYTFELGLMPELLQNLAWLFWPRAVEGDGWTSLSMWVGLALGGAVSLTGWRMRNRRPLIGLGLFLALCGMLPTVPGPLAVAGCRYAYPASIGASLLIAGLFGMLWWWRQWFTWRVVAALGMLAWLAVNILAIRSVERWWYEPECRRLERLVVSSAPVASEPAAVVISPAILNAADYRHVLAVWHGLPSQGVSCDLVPYGHEFLSRLQPGGDLDPREHPIFACRYDGQVFRLESSSDAPLQQWLEKAEEHEQRRRGRTIALIRRVAPDR